MNILVTGANGFVGKHFITIANQQFNCTAISLQNNNWQTQTFNGIDTVLHLAGKAHQMEPIDDQIYFDINYTLTKLLFEKCVADGVKHFIYISSTKVYGDDILTELNEQSPCNPTDAYGKSKLAAEQYLLQQKSMVVTIVRPPLIYGAGVKGNLLKIMQLCNSNKPLPFGNINNQRSMVGIHNLVAMLSAIILLQKPGIFVPCDAAPISTTTLVSCIRKALQRKPNIFSIPIFMRSIIKKLRPALYTRLFGSFYINNTYTNHTLQFVPPYTTEQGITIMVNAFDKTTT